AWLFHHRTGDGSDSPRTCHHALSHCMGFSDWFGTLAGFLGLSSVTRRASRFKSAGPYRGREFCAVMHFMLGRSLDPFAKQSEHWEISSSPPLFFCRPARSWASAIACYFCSVG